jgi:hypothetical protein
MVYSYYLETALPVCTVRPAMWLDTSSKRLLAVQRKMDKIQPLRWQLRLDERLGAFGGALMAQTL